MGPLARLYTIMSLSLAAGLNLAGCDSFTRPAARIQRAESALAAGRFAAAIADLKTVLEKEPNNGAARLLLAEVSLAAGDLDSASKELQRAAVPGVNAARLAAVRYQLWSAQARHQDIVAAATADQTLAPLQRAHLLADAYTAMGKLDEADAVLQQAETLDPAGAVTRLQRARWLLAKSDLAGATRLLDALVAASPPLPEAVLLRAQLALRLGDPKSAQTILARLPAEAAARLGLMQQVQLLLAGVDAALAVNDLPRAMAEAGRLQALAPGSFLQFFVNARVALAQGKAAAAVEQLQHALLLDPKSLPARLLFGAALSASGSPEQAIDVLNGVLAEQPQNAQARLLLAGVHVKRNDQQSAQRVIGEAPAGSAGHDANLDWMSSALYLRSGQTARAIPLLESAVASQPANGALQLDLARAYLLDGRRDDALKALQRVPAGTDRRARAQLLVLATASGRSLEAARESLLEMAKANPDDMELQNAAAGFFAAAGVPASAADLYRAVMARKPDDLQAQLGLAALALQRRDGAEAKRLFGRVNALDAREERAYLGLAATAQLEGDAAGQLQWLESAIRANPAVVEARVRLAELLFARKEPARARSLLDQALAVTQTRPVTLNRVGLTLFRAGQFDDALQRFHEAAGQGYDEAVINTALTLATLGRPNEARGPLEAAHARRPAWSAPVTLLTGFDVAQRHFEQAGARLRVFEKAGGDVAIVHDLRGDLLANSGQPAEALKEYQLSQLQTPSAALSLKLFNLRRQLKLAIPEQSLVSWLDRHPEDTALRATLAQYFDSRGDAAAAIRHYELALKSNADPRLLNNLAWLYQGAGDSRALATARQAYQLQPQNVAIQDTYGWILLEAGKVTEALPLLTTAAGTKGLNDPEIKYHYAAALAAAGRGAEAQAALRELLQQFPSFASRAKAETLLKKVS